MSKGREPERLDGADPELSRALRALAQERPNTEALARVRDRLQQAVSNPGGAGLHARRPSDLRGAWLAGAAVLGALVLGQRLLRPTAAPAAPSGGDAPATVPAAASAKPELPLRAPERTQVATDPGLDEPSKLPTTRAVEPRPRLETTRHEPAHAPKTKGPRVRSPGGPEPVAAPSGHEGAGLRTTPAAQDDTATRTSSAPAVVARPETTTAQPAGHEAEREESALPAPPDEPALLLRARLAAASDPKLALRLLDQHRRLYPHGSLTPEREVLAIELLRRLSRAQEADRRADAFRRAYPDSIYLPRVAP